MPSQKVDAKSIWYTDGSKQVRDDGTNVMELVFTTQQREFLALSQSGGVRRYKADHTQAPRSS